jgi:hypothetical protein
MKSDDSSDVHDNADFTAHACYPQVTDVEEFPFCQPVTTNNTWKNLP